MSGRTVDFELRGVTYPLCFTLEAAEDFYRRYGDIDGWFPRLSELTRQVETDPDTGETKVLVEGDQIKLLAELLWLLDTLMQAGYYYSAWDKEEAETPPGPDELRRIICIGDISRIQTAVIQTITLGNQREVGSGPAKNGEGAQDAV